MSSFNLGKTLAKSLAVPLAAAVGTAATKVIDGMFKPVSTPKPETTNYAVAGPADKIAEAGDKLLSQGNIEDFSELAPNIGLETTDGVTSIKDSIRGEIMAQVGESRSQAQNIFEEAQYVPSTIDMKVTITQEPPARRPIIFEVMPTISEDGGASYESFTPVHHPGEILKYTGSTARSWQISAQLISRNITEASNNLEMLNIIRSWRMPYYGAGTEENQPELLGAPPPILTLTAYGGRVIGPVKCVMESYSTSWPNDVDYLPAIDYSSQDGTESRPFPVILSININLKESWSPKEFSGFSMFDYQIGNMPAAFSTIRQPKPTTAPASLNWGGEARDTSGKRYDKSEPANITTPR